MWVGVKVSTAMHRCKERVAWQSGLHTGVCMCVGGYVSLLTLHLHLCKACIRGYTEGAKPCCLTKQHMLCACSQSSAPRPHAWPPCSTPGHEVLHRWRPYAPLHMHIRAVIFGVMPTQHTAQEPWRACWPSCSFPAVAEHSLPSGIAPH